MDTIANRDRPVSPLVQEEDRGGEELSLRPRVMSEYIGQPKLKENLKVFIAAAKARGEALDHVLLCGPPGLGKSTLAGVIASELGVSLRATSGPAIEKQGDLAAVLTNLDRHDVLFIDEIHRLRSVIEEVLYPVMEDYELDLIIGQGPDARSVKIPLPRFTLIGATTRTGLLTSPLRDRFGVVARLEFYPPEELQAVASRSARILGMALADDGAWEVARRSRGTPRIANRHLRRVRDFAQVDGEERVDRQVVDRALKRMGVDEIGLDDMDRKILLTLIDKFGGGPVGLETIAIAIGEEADTLSDVYEPYLVQIGFLDRTARGRIATRRAYEHFQRAWREMGAAQQSDLF